MKRSDRPVSLREIALELGISHATVSLALRKDPRISTRRREEIVAAAERLGYRPDPMLQQLAAYRRSSEKSRIGSCIAWLNAWHPPEGYHQFGEFRAYWRGALATSERLGYNLEEFRLRPDRISSQRLFDTLNARGIRGIIIPPHLKDTFYLEGDWRDFSVVKIGFSVPNIHTHVITSDQYGGGQLAATKMTDFGYRRIGFVCRSSFNENTRGNFLAGFQHARDERIRRSERIAPLIFDGDKTATAKKTFLAWLKSNQPEAILFAPSIVVSWIKDAGLRVPQDVALAGVSMTDAEVDSGLNQLPEEVGGAAVEFLSGLLTHREFGLPQHARLLFVEPVWESGKTLPTKKAASPDLALA